MDRRIAVAATILIALTTLGCAQSLVPPAQSSDETITVVDGRGKEITLTGEAERVVTIPMPAASIFMAIDGSANRLVGMHPASMGALEEGILKEIYPDALDVSTDFISEGFTPNVEEVLRLEPDVVLQWAGRGDDLLAPMENAGLTVIGVEYGNQENLETLLHIMGQVAGTPDKAQRIIDYHHETRDAVAAETESMPSNERPRVLYFLRYADEWRVSGRDTYNDFYITLAGGTNVADDGPAEFFEVDAEQILAWDPEVILLGGFDDAVPQDVYDNDLLSSVSAVENRRVYKVPLGGYRWDPPSQESPLMWKWLATLLLPDTFEYDLRADTRDFYAWVYGYELSDAELDSILRMSLNGNSAAYAPFAGK